MLQKTNKQTNKQTNKCAVGSCMMRLLSPVFKAWKIALDGALN